MKKYIFAVIVSLVLIQSGMLGTRLQAQYNNREIYDPNIEIVTASQNIVKSINADAFNPLTHFNGGDIDISGMGFFFRPRTMMDSGGKHISAEDSKGYGSNITAYFALTNRLMFSVSHTGIFIEGTIRASNDTASHVSRFQTGVDNLQAGAGFDLIAGSTFSMPLMVRYKIEKYKIDINGHSEVGDLTTGVASSYVNLEGTGEDVITGIIGCIAFSARFQVFSMTYKITPYLIFGKDLAAPQLAYTVTDSGTYRRGTHLNSEGFKDGYTLPCLNISFVSASNFSFSLNVSGTVFRRFNYYNERYLDGLDMSMISLAVGYRLGSEGTGAQ